LTHLVSTYLDFRFLHEKNFLYLENMIVTVQYNILRIFITSVKLIKFILYFIVVLLINERDLEGNASKYNIVLRLPYFQDKL